MQLWGQQYKFDLEIAYSKETYVQVINHITFRNYLEIIRGEGIFFYLVFMNH